MSSTSYASPVRAAAPTRPIAYATPDVACTRDPDGTVRLSSRQPLAPYEPSLAKLFRSAVEAQPGRIALAERQDGAWRTLRYEQARPIVDAIAAALLERGLSAERPVMILSGNAIDHALLMLAGYTAGVPVAPVSVAYSLQSQDHEKLKHIVELIDPALVYVSDTAPFAKAVASIPLSNCTIVAARNGANLPAATAFDDLTRTAPGPAVEAAARAITADTVAKILFTSGSTGLPKGVINTHRMLTANQQQISQLWPFVAEQPLVLMDWLPWNHTFGGNHNFNMVLRNAGTLYIDAGKPAPGLIDETVRNLSEVSPIIYFNVPAGYAALMPFLERDDAFARSFFAKLRLIFYAGAALPQDLWQRLDAVALRVIGECIPMTSSWGTTETAPMSTMAHFPLDRAGSIGVPAPGVDIKLAPSGAKLEIRVRGPNITPGYWKRPDLTAAAFDDEGFYRPGDAVRFSDPGDLTKGVEFDGRLAEDFKLLTGTWVHVGALRVGVLAAASPALQDAIVAGENRDFVGLLAWLNVAGCQRLLADGTAPAAAALARDVRLRKHVRACVTRWNAAHTGASQQIARVLLLAEPPSIDANEITDKGYINQRVTLDRRHKEVERLFAAEPDADVIVI